MDGVHVPLIPPDELKLVGLSSEEVIVMISVRLDLSDLLDLIDLDRLGLPIDLKQNTE